MRDFIAVSCSPFASILQADCNLKNPNFLPMPSPDTPSTNPVIEFPLLGYLNQQVGSSSAMTSSGPSVVRTAKKSRTVQFADP